MILEDVAASVAAQLRDQANLGVQVVAQADVPESGPARRGEWWRIQNVTAVFADLKGSTSLAATGAGQDAALAYTYFVRAMAVILEGFGARYIEIQGDGVFGLFSGRGSTFAATACAITMRFQTADVVAQRFRQGASTQWALRAGVGVDRGTLLVRRLGLRGARQNEA